MKSKSGDSDIRGMHFFGTDFKNFFSTIIAEAFELIKKLIYLILLKKVISFFLHT